MGRLADRLRKTGFQLRVKQERAALDIVDQISDAMSIRHVSQADLAGKLAKSPAWISKVLHGGRNIEIFTAVELADALGFDIAVSLRDRGAHSVASEWVRDPFAVSIGDGDAVYAVESEANPFVENVVELAA